MKYYKINKMKKVGLQAIKAEFLELEKEPLSNIGVSVGLANKNNFFEWRFTILGPSDTKYKDGLFYLKVLFNEDYPNSKPEVRFVTPIYHVNVNPLSQYGNEIDPLGHVCISTINKWKPDYTMRKVFLEIFALFYLGNPKDPFVPEMKKEMEENRQLYDKKVEYFTKKYAAIDKEYQEYDKWDFTYPPKEEKEF